MFLRRRGEDKMIHLLIFILLLITALLCSILDKFLFKGTVKMQVYILLNIAIILAAWYYKLSNAIICTIALIALSIVRRLKPNKAAYLIGAVVLFATSYFLLNDYIGVMLIAALVCEFAVDYLNLNSNIQVLLGVAGLGFYLVYFRYYHAYGLVYFFIFLLVMFFIGITGKIKKIYNN